MEPVKLIAGEVSVLDRDHVDTDQIIPKQFLKRVERTGFGQFLFYDWAQEDDWNLPANPILATGANFGSGSSREHAPLALAEAGVQCVIAEFYARIFFRNSVNGGYLIPFESQERLVDRINTGDELEVLVDQRALVNKTDGNRYALKPLGDVLPIIEAGGVFNYAKQAGMLK